MNRPSLLQYLGMAVLLSLTALATEFILWRLSNVHDALRYTLLLTAMLYLGWLLPHSSQHTGRLILGTITLSILTGMLLWSDSLFVLIPVLTTAPWIIRTLLYYSGIAPSSIDLGLSLSSMAICHLDIRTHRRSAAGNLVLSAASVAADADSPEIRQQARAVPGIVS